MDKSGCNGDVLRLPSSVVDKYSKLQQRTL